MTRSPRLLAVAALCAGLALTGCSTTVSLQPAPDSNNPSCAAISVRLPGNLDGQQRVWTNAQATAAWGTPTKIIYTCGVTPPGPSTLKCITLSGVDWLVDESRQPLFTLTTYGRTPAVQVFLDAGSGSQDTDAPVNTATTVDPNAVLSQLGTIIAPQTKKSAQCTDPGAVPK